MRQIILLFLCGVIFTTPAWTEDPELSVEIDKDDVVLGDSIRLTITVEGTTPNAPPELPPLPDFEIQYLGSRTESFSSLTVVIQGQKREEHRSGGGTQFEYALTPKRMGSFAIPPFSFVMDGKNYRTSEPYLIKVTDLPEAREDIFLKVSVDQETVYLGESVLLTFEWYFNKDVRDYSLNIPWFSGVKGFLIEDPKPDPSRQVAQLIVNDKEKVAAERKGATVQGKRYTVLRFQKVLTPISAGQYALDPAFLRAEIVKGYEESQMKRVPFFRYYSDIEDLFNVGKKAVTERVLARSNPLTLTVKMLPEQNKPSPFTGAVGSFDFQVSVAPETVKKGEPVTVTMKVVGTGNFNEVQLPDFPELSAFKGYTPEIKTDTSTADGMVIGEKTFTKVLVGRREGKYEIPPLSFSYFEPGSGEYKTIARGPFPIEVQPGAAQEEMPQMTTLTPQAARPGKEIKVIGHDIRYIKGNLGVVKRPSLPLYKIPLFLLFGFTSLPLVSAVSFLIERRRERFRTDVAYARRTHAYKNAEELLIASSGHLLEGDAGQFYSDLSRLLIRYLSDKLNLPPGTLPHELLEALKKVLQTKRIDEELLNELKAIFDKADLVKYSRASGDREEMEKMWEKAKTLLNRLERMSG